jgi:hypothetical protein
MDSADLVQEVCTGNWVEVPSGMWTNDFGAARPAIKGMIAMMGRPCPGSDEHMRGGLEVVA